MAEELQEVYNAEPDLEEIKRTVEPERVRDKEYRSVYSNFAQCGRTAWDIRLTFSELGEVEPDKPGIIDLMSVTMTPQLAKALISVLSAHVAMYERENGEVQMPKSVIRESQERAARIKASASPSVSASASPSSEASDDKT